MNAGHLNPWASSIVIISIRRPVNLRGSLGNHSIGASSAVIPTLGATTSTKVGPA
jgi:hypothetical protein